MSWSPHHGLLKVSSVAQERTGSSELEIFWTYSFLAPADSWERPYSGRMDDACAGSIDAPAAVRTSYKIVDEFLTRTSVLARSS